MYIQKNEELSGILELTFDEVDLVIGGGDKKKSDDKSSEPVRKLTQQEIDQLNEAFGKGGSAPPSGGGSSIKGVGPKISVGKNTTIQGARTKSNAPSGNSGSGAGVVVTVSF